MIRQIIKIDEDKCTGCGLCADACREGAIGMVNGKAKLLRDDYCDGLGNCLPACPTGAITFENREAAEYSETAVAAKNAGDKNILKENVHMSKQSIRPEPLACGCPGTQMKTINRKPAPVNTVNVGNDTAGNDACGCGTAPAPAAGKVQSQLNQWPVQIKLVPPNAPYFKNANLLIAADCTAYAYGNFHNDFMRNKITIIGCPKLDEGDYSEKLTAILKNNDIKSVTVIRMEVPCCGGLENAVKTALSKCGKLIPWQAVVISTDGEVLE